MTTVQHRSHQIAGVEKFEILIKKDNVPLDLRANGLLSAYPWSKALKGTKTVTQWKNGRFKVTYPGFDCDVLYDDGSVAIGQTLLSTVRDSYEEE